MITSEENLMHARLLRQRSRINKAIRIRKLRTHNVITRLKPRVSWTCVTIVTNGRNISNFVKNLTLNGSSTTTTSRSTIASSRTATTIVVTLIIWSICSDMTGFNRKIRVKWLLRLRWLHFNYWILGIRLRRPKLSTIHTHKIKKNLFPVPSKSQFTSKKERFEFINRERNLFSCNRNNNYILLSGKPSIMYNPSCVAQAKIN